MTYIENVLHNDLIIPIIEKELVVKGENIFSVLVGKNGSGKSSILLEMARKLNMDVARRIAGEHGFPSRIIAVSTSPFDRFPTSQSSTTRDIKDFYTYIGMKNGGGRSSAISLISKATVGLIGSFNKRENNLLSVFDSMGLIPKITVNWKSLDFQRNSTPRSKSQSKQESDYDLFVSNLASKKIYPEAQVLIEIASDYKDYFDRDDIINISYLGLDELILIRNSLETFQSLGWDSSIPSIDFNFLDGTIYFSKNKEIFFSFEHDRFQEDESLQLNAIVTLAKYNVIKVNDIKIFRPLNENGSSLRRASSGEQCMLVMMLGIAGYLENNAVVLIDEPEISLHPEWQEDFIGLLMRCFSSFSGCHFILATHSPQIVAKLSGNNCFVTNLEKREIFSSSTFSMKSSDFQLAEIFNAPGFKNEYIIRICFDLIAKIRTRKKIDFDIEQSFIKILDLKAKLEENDPVEKLINSIEELYSSYANNQ